MVQNYRCDLCNFSTHIKTHYMKHINTNKHLKNTNKHFKNTNKHLKKQNELDNIYNNIYPNYNSIYMTPIDSKMTPIDSKMTPNGVNITSSGSTITSGSKKKLNITSGYKKKYKTNVIKYFYCDLCNQGFTRKNNLKRHLKDRCKGEIKIKEEEQDYKILFEKYKETTEKQMEHLYRQIDSLIDRVGDVNITQNNIVLNSYGQEDLSHITENFMTSIIKIPYGAIPKMIEKVHFSEDKPENKNICIPNKKQPYLKVFNADKWVLCDRKEAIKTIVNRNYGWIDDFYKNKIKNNLDEEQKKRYLDFKNKKDNGNITLEDKIHKDIDLLILNYNK